MPHLKPLKLFPLFMVNNMQNKISLPEKPFKSDGCSGGFTWLWIRIFKKPPPFNHCCVTHDQGYHFGAGAGASRWDNIIARLQDDFNLAKCMWFDGWQGKVFALPFFVVVRFAGGAYWKRARGWGYGWEVNKVK